MSTSTPSRIGSLNETSLHAALKEWVRAGAPNQDSVAESNVDGYVVDVRLPGELVEIQTGSFAAVRDKLTRLVQHHVVRLVHPIAAVNRISKISTSGELKSRRRSPKRGRVEDVFLQLVYLCKQLPHPNLIVEVLLIEQQEIRRDDGKGSRRRRWVSILDKQLLSVQEVIRLSSLSDYAAFLPPELDGEFTNSEIAAATGIRRRTAQAMTYSLRQMGALEIVGKRGREQLFNRSEEIGIVGETRPGSSGDRATAS